MWGNVWTRNHWAAYVNLVIFAQPTLSSIIRPDRSRLQEIDSIGRLIEIISKYPDQVV
jgi:hypothetical protein